MCSCIYNILMETLHWFPHIGTPIVDQTLIVKSFKSSSSLKPYLSNKFLLFIALSASKFFALLAAYSSFLLYVSSSFSIFLSMTSSLLVFFLGWALSIALCFRLKSEPLFFSCFKRVSSELFW